MSRKIREKDFSDKGDLKDIIRIGQEYAPIDAHLISLDGIYNEKIGSSLRAQELFTTSLAILPTGYQALVYRFNYLFENKQYVKALDIINIVSKRWPKRQNTFQNFIPVIALNSAGFKHASKLFTSSRQLRILMVTALVRNPATIHLAVELVQNWDANDNTSFWKLGNFITKKLLNTNKYNEANLAFRSFLNKKQQSEYKYIYNGDFTNPSLKNHFDWSISKQVGVSTMLNIKSST